MVGKLSFVGGVVLAACLGLAAPAAADPSVFGVLSCNCGDSSPGSAPGTDDMTAGMQQGLSVLPIAFHTSP